MMQNVWNDYVTTADGVYVSATEADAYITELEVERGEIILTLEAQDLSLAAKADRIAGLESEIKAYDLRMDNDAKRITELEAERVAVAALLTETEQDDE